MKINTEMKIWISVFTSVLAPFCVFAGTEPLVIGRNFSVPATQQINFVLLRKTDPSLFTDPSLPRKVDLRDIQSAVKSQGPRGACTYFVMTGLLESLILKSTGKEVDLSEEYLAWSGKAKLKLRSLEEDSSVAVNALAVQQEGFMFEEDLPYEPSWFGDGFPCAGEKKSKTVNPVCFSHSGPAASLSKKVRSGGSFEFRDIGSSSGEVVREIAKSRVPVTVSILAHLEMWEKTKKTGDIFLNKRAVRECKLRPTACSGHAALITGYDLDRKVFFFKNSWGPSWGDRGYGTIPFDYMDQMSERRFLTGQVSGPIDID